MPQSLMLGFRAEATGDTEIKVDADEIAEAHWYSRDDLRAAIGTATCCCRRQSRSRTASSCPGTAAGLPGNW